MERTQQSGVAPPSASCITENKNKYRRRKKRHRGAPPNGYGFPWGCWVPCERFLEGFDIFFLFATRSRSSVGSGLVSEFLFGEGLLSLINFLQNRLSFVDVSVGLLSCCFFFMLKTLFRECWFDVVLLLSCVLLKTLFS